MKKGRHRRFEEARALKRTNDNLDEILDARDAEPCPECGADPGHDHAVLVHVRQRGRREGLVAPFRGPSVPEWSQDR